MTFATPFSAAGRARSRPAGLAVPSLLVLLPLVFLAGLSGCSPGAAPAGEAPADSSPPPRRGSGALEAPALVVVVVVDQLRGDLLERYDDLFHHGFRRLRDEGFVYTAASHRHGVTETASGHATLSTGVFPSRHGIVANSWEERREGEWEGMYAVEDPGSPILGSPRSSGRSPRNLRRPGLADWIVASGEGAQVVSVSSKDRGAIPMAGQAAGHVYWMAMSEGRFVTSTHYADRYPGWVEDFNRRVMPDLFADSVWIDALPAEAEGRSRPDEAPYERDGIHTTFPHRYMAEAATPGPEGLRRWIGRTPRPDEATLGLALEALDALELGRRGVTDYLSVSFSQTDYIGHDYGPLSREQLDNLVRLDAVVGRLLQALDEKVGRGRWVLAFSSDHGVADSPEWRAEQGLPGARLDRGDRGRLRAAVATAVEGGRERKPVAETFPFVARAYEHEALRSGQAVDSFAGLFRNSLYEGRAAALVSPFGLEIRAEEGVLFGGERRGSGHGTPYWYDRWVPLVFLGAGVASGESIEPAYTVDVAPTLAHLSGIPVPDDLDGRILQPAVGER